MLIVFEGIDAIGKTTLAKELAEKWNIKYFRGGGWQRGTPLEKRAQQEGASARNKYFGLMQLGCLRDLQKLAKENEVTVVDRLVVVDIAHHLAFAYNEDSGDFSEEAQKIARGQLGKYLPEGEMESASKRGIDRKQIAGIVLDITDIDTAEERIRSSLKDEGIMELPEGTISLREWLRGHNHLPEADTLERFEAKRQAWLWCAKELGWKVIDASGSKEEVFKNITGILERNRVFIERLQTAGESIAGRKEKE